MTIRFSFEEITDSTAGACLACGAYTDGVEPDARKYTCPSCGKKQVYGAEELLIMGKADIGPED